jgi:hypothetical protein
MTLQLSLISTSLVLFGLVCQTSLMLAQAEAPSPFSSSAATPGGSVETRASTTESPVPVPTYSLAPYEQRLAAAQSVKVMTAVLGLELGSTLKQAQAKLDKLSDPKHPPKEETEGSEGKVLWQMADTDYSAIFVKFDDEKITYIHAIVRPGKEIPFDKIGEAQKAPAQNANTIAWDVLRPNRPLFRVVANGVNRKASSLTLFTVKRAGHHRAEEQR